MNPKVRFIVPCHNLAHLLPNCLNSILAQTYSDFDALIMDDCSPAHTPEVAQACSDRRVRHVRHARNLGNIGNDKKGMALSRGPYIWLISADDYLQWEYLLQC